MGICYGGAAQLFAGIFEWKRGKQFTAVAFISYGTFWWSFVLLNILPGNKPDDMAMGFYLFIWGFFTLCMLIAARKKSLAVKTIFFTLVILFWLLAIEHWTKVEAIGKAAGVIGIICAWSAIYVGAAELINENLGKNYIPLG